MVIDTADYEKKVADLLEHPPFKKLKKDPTARNEDQVYDVAKTLAKKGAIDETSRDCLRVPSKATRPSLFYGSVKIHKIDHPFRPIVSTLGSTTYGIASEVSNILSPYVKQVPSYFSNTSEFIDILHNTTIADDEVMVSFDVQSL